MAISITSERKQPLKTMISMVLSGYVACICAAAISTSGILCVLFFINDHVARVKGNTCNGGTISEIDKMTTLKKHDNC